MRTIKFRARHVKTGEWFYGTLHEGTTNNDLSLDAFWSQVRHGILDAETAGQWTGLFDKSSVEIYEGDVVHMGFYAVDMDAEGNAVETHDFSAEWTGPVEYQCGDGCGFYVGGDIPLMGEADVLERLGNIHENPELLETR